MMVVAVVAVIQTVAVEAALAPWVVAAVVASNISNSH
jgi:hypothetical protein